MHIPGNPAWAALGGPQERGAYRTSYPGTTLREHLELPPFQRHVWSRAVS